MRLLTYYFSLLCFCAPTLLCADTVILNNGDQISGEIKSKQDDKLVITTSYAGDISVLWSEVKRLNADKALQLILNDDTRIKGSLKSSDANELVRIQHQKIASPIDIKLSQIKFINPAPELIAVVTKVSGRVNAGVSISSGNTEAKKYSLDTEVVVRSQVNRFTIAANLFKATENSISTEDKNGASVKYDHFLAEKQYIYGNASVDRDKFKDLKLKSAIGIGYGYQLFETDQVNASFEGGLSMINDDYYLAKDMSFSAARWSLKYDRKFWNDKIQFFHQHEGLIDTTDTQNISINFQTGFRFPIYTGMNATLQLNTDWDKTPPVGVKKTDHQVLFSVGYLW